MDKFPSTTTLWQVLRKFEAGVAGDGNTSRNLTARGVPSTQAGEGRLYYEQPVVQLMNRELASLTDLQKNLAQLGLNSGSAFIRLTFRATDTPLEEAMAQTQQYFDSVDGPAPTRTQPQSQPTTTSPPAPQPGAVPTPDNSMPPTTTNTQPSPNPPAPEPSHAPSPQTTSPITSRPLSVYRPPSSTAPSAASLTHNEADYTPTIEHAQVHQKLLNQSSRNTRLPTDAEIAAQQQEEQAKLAEIKDVEIKIRFPDQSSVTSKFGQGDSGTTLYGFVRECLDEKVRDQSFVLRNPGVRAGSKGDTIPDNDKKLIRDLALKGRVLVIFGWADNASAEARGVRSVLREELRKVAEEIKLDEGQMNFGGVGEEKGVKVNVGRKDEGEEAGGGGGGVGRKMPKWLKGLSKK
jgi:tether containing UBX domain for GLUT4